ncbi:pantetheine-phosphate adenylyltransferase [Hathewaya histolytica]|uniref:pantetheine-phosphate adenylyltransferase n=1 Tax=Hathewaya histolytica TaxID=1498 RepID=UPI003B6767C6
MKRAAVYAGSFDPITNGHLDIIDRASRVFDQLIVGVLINPDKKGLFSIEERVELINKVIKSYNNVKVEGFEGLLVDFMDKHDASVIVKGLRAVSDFEYEFQMAMMNNKLDNTKETIFMATSPQYSYLSSSAVKQVAKFGGCIRDLVPNELNDIIIKKVIENK